MTGEVPPTSDPLTPEQHAELREAGERARKVLGAAKVATFNGWSIGSFAAVTLPFGLFSLTTLVLGAGMAVVAWNEFRGRKLLRRLDPLGPRLLGRNQIGFMGLIVAYCLVNILRTLYGAGPDLSEIEAVIGPTEDLVRTLTLVVYGGVILVTVLFQGLNARYYFRRIGMMEEYLETTPRWVVEIQRAAATE